MITVEELLARDLPDVVLVPPLGSGPVRTERLAEVGAAIFPGMPPYGRTARPVGRP